MSPVSAKPKSLTIGQIKQKARHLGIEPGKMTKTQLIHAIQQAEGYNTCYGTAQGWCEYESCCFRGDCLK
jgi:hypothetical protein